MAERITIARPYAKAVFALASSQKRLPQWSEALQLAASVVADERVAALIHSPKVTPAQLAEFIAGIGGKQFDEQAHNLLVTLADYRRLGFLPEIAAHYEQLRADAERTIDVTVTSAVELSTAQRDGFAAAMRKRLNREVRLHCEIDPTLLGGAVVRADDLVIDGSVRGSLTQLAAAAAS
jgi:F-type H+-transporting ATPase subunit delta